MKQFSFAISIFSLLFLSTLDSSAQSVKNYEQEWQKVEGFVKKNLPASALTQVKKIYTLAKKDKQEAQVIKALAYMTELQSENRENNESLSINEIEKEIPQASEAAASILNSMLAEMYWNYYQSHRWEFYNRTETKAFKKDDIATWAAEDFYKTVGELYLRSLKNEKLLQQTKLESFDAIIMEGNVRHLRPTLYDLLAHRAVDYFENDEPDITRPAYAFEIDQAAAFDPAADFIHRKFKTNDSLSLHHKALLIYQNLIAFHLNDKKPDALIDADLKRYEFVRSESTHPDKDILYFNGVNHIAHQYESTPAASQAWYLVAKFYNERASHYKPYGDTTHRFDRVLAKNICEKILTQKDSSEGKINCYNLLTQINQKSFQFQLEKVNIPNYPFRVLLDYQNLTTLHLRIIKVDEALKKSLENRYEDKYWNSIIAAAPVRSWKQALPATNDFQEHKTEVKIDALPAGDYMLVAATDESLSNKKTLVGARIFFVSTISYVNDGNDYFILNRDNGQPMARASVQIWENRYDYKQSKYIREKTKLYTTDANGFFHLDKPKKANNTRQDNYSFQLDIQYNKERLFLDEWQYDPYYYRTDETNPITAPQVYFFTDRSIYRPGQTLYFKGLALSQDKSLKKGSVLSGYETIVYLIDVNGQHIDSLKMKSNEFGSFNGTFKLPATALNGQFTLEAKGTAGVVRFQVEEYKRPKFSVDYEPIKGTYKVNDTIQVTGIAKAYAGNNIDGATVKYRVVRQARFIYSWSYLRGYLPPSPTMEIINGQIKTDKEGKFIIRFAAIPDLQVDRKLDPFFDYTVYADVTDINGETRSGEQSVTVSYKALLLQAYIPSSLPADSLRSLNIRTANMAGEFEPSILKVTITKLKSESRLIRSRIWDRPDQFVMSKSEYIKNFPFDEYDNETDQTTWEKQNTVFEKSDSIKENTPFALSNAQLTPGHYVIEISTKDKYGQEVKEQRFIELSNEKSNKLNTPQYLWAEGANPIEPGEKTTVKLGTSGDNIFIIQQEDKRPADSDQSPSYSFVKLDNEKKTFDFTATEADRGGYGVSWIFVKHNRVYEYNQTILVPWTNKNLTVEYATYRDKTLPGSEEKWKLKISGYKKEKVAAELLASMYDASLDQFNPHYWYPPSIWNSYFRSNNWESRQNFIALDAELRNLETTDSKELEKTYDVLSPYQRVEYIYDKKARRFLSLSKVEMRGQGMADVAVSYNAAPAAMQTDANANMRWAAADSTAYSFTTTSEMFINGEVVKKPTSDNTVTEVRKNFNETAFFFPDLRTDSTGAIEFSFTLPEALTKWKFQTLAHTKDLAFGYSSKEIVTQKDLMVQPNSPRFLREGDKMEFSAKIVNLSDKELTGTAEFQLFDAATNEPVDGRFQNMVPNQYFTVAAGQSEAVKFPIEVPFQFNKALLWRIVAKAGNFSDGEEAALPVLTNRMLVTESITLPMKGSGTKQFTFDKLLNSGSSETIQHHALTVEYTSNPVWYAVQALPYLMEYPYECAEQTWNRYYANSLATMIANSSPRMKQIFERWKNLDTTALLSNLQKNQELKSVLLEETPWVLQAKTEAEQKKNLALLFDMYKMSTALNGSYEKLKQLQSSNGGFVWFVGGPDDRYMTQYILTGIGHLKKLKSFAPDQDTKLKSIIAAAIPYLDSKIKQDYDQLIKDKVDLKKYIPYSTIIQYFYMRSFFPEYKIAAASQTAYNYFMSRLSLAWLQQNKYMQGMTALVLSRKGDIKTAAAILKSLKETSIVNEELGRYWKDQSRSWWWYEAPIERQALLIEAFQETGKDLTTVDELRTWLLKNKQTNKWESTKATAEACYALLLQGNNWLSSEPVVTIKLGNTTVSSTSEKEEAGTGYFKKSIDGARVFSTMGNIAVTVENPVNVSPSQPVNTTWGAVYWQYFEDLDKITTASTPLRLQKKLFVETNSDRGPVLTPLKDGESFKIDDKIKVRIELKVDRDMEYVHMKDMRASGLEPVNVLSGYRWQGGLGYYETTKDASTNFFFSSLRKGTYVFEYSLFASQAGNFSNGITSIQCMYAPEFTAHSEGIRVSIE